jgi:hypothetical protein
MTKDAIMKNWIVPICSKYNPKRLTVQIIDKAMMDAASELMHRPLLQAQHGIEYCLCCQNYMST